MKNKSKVNKVIRISSIFLGICIPIVVIFGFSGINSLTFSSQWTSTNVITMGGSSAVFPLATNLGKTFFNSNANLYNADVNVVAGGSGKGISYAASLTKNIGNASKNPYDDVNNPAKNLLTDWTNNNIKTMTIAWDAIAIVYKPANISDPTIVLDTSNIVNLYNIIRGEQLYPLSTLGLNESGYFYPYARSGGADASGTATSFLEQSDLVDYKTLDPTLFSALKSGSYGGNTHTTNESNLETWNQIKSDNKVGTITYLSLGFVKSNQSEIENSGFKVAFYKNPIDNLLYNPLNAEISSKGYSWFSPLNCMFSTTKNPNYVYDFIWWLLTSNEAIDTIVKQNFIPLTDSNKAKMFLNNSFTSSSTLNDFLEANDIALGIARENDPILKQYTNWYGAYK